MEASLLTALALSIAWFIYELNKIPATEEGRDILRSKRIMRSIQRNKTVKKKLCLHRFEKKNILDVDGSVVRKVCVKCDLIKLL